MALQTIPGVTGYAYGMINSMDQRAIGKFTDTNHLSTIRSEEPAMYDKKIIDIYTQTSLEANDFLNMLNQSDPYYIKGNTDAWQWEYELPFQPAKILELPSDTANATKVGIDNQTFDIVFDTNQWVINHVITSHRMYGPQLFVVKDPLQWSGGGWVYTVTLITDNPKSDFVDKRFLQPGIEYHTQGGLVGEFDQDLLTVGRTSNRLKMFESLGAGIGWEHTITGWADARNMRDNQGKELDLVWYLDNGNRRPGPVTANNIKWEPMVERLYRMDAMSQKVNKMIWNKPGTARTRGTAQEIKKSSAGLYHRMRHNGNFRSYPKGEFTPNIFRTVFGDIFYRRVDIAKRRVKIYTNEAGFRQFNQAMKDDAMNSGLSFVVSDTGGDRFVQGKGRNMVMNWGFSGMVTAETGEISLVHLKELDQPHNSLEYGQNYMTPPVYMVFDISPDGNGTLKGNVREVRHEGAPTMTYGYIDGRTHHLGHFASHGHSAGQKLNGYTFFMDDRYDVFVEDLSRTFLIKEESEFD